MDPEAGAHEADGAALVVKRKLVLSSQPELEPPRSTAVVSEEVPQAGEAEKAAEKEPAKARGDAKKSGQKVKGSKKKKKAKSKHGKDKKKSAGGKRGKSKEVGDSEKPVAILGATVCSILHPTLRRNLVTRVLTK